MSYRWLVTTSLVLAACRPEPGRGSDAPGAAGTGSEASAQPRVCENPSGGPSAQALSTIETQLDAIAGADPGCADELRLGLAQAHLSAHAGDGDDAHLRKALDLHREVILRGAADEERVSRAKRAASSILEVPASADEVSVGGQGGRLPELMDLHEALGGREPEVDAAVLEVALAHATELGDEETAQVARFNLVDAYLEVADFDAEGGVTQLEAARRLLEDLLASKVRADLHEAARQQLVHVDERLGRD